MGSERGLFLCFVFGFVVRLIPEALSFPLPIGFDTMGYAVRIKDGVVWSQWSSMFSTWLLYAILIAAYNVIRVDPFFLLKLAAPTLYALNVCGIYFFARKTLGWEIRKAMVAAFFFAFQLASLRLSWDLYRNMLGLGVLLFALSFIHEIGTKKGFVMFVLLSTLVVFSHEIASVIMLVVVLGLMVSDFLKGKNVRVFKVLAAVLPALAIFLASTYLYPHNVSLRVETNVISVHDTIHQNPGDLIFLVNYLSVSDTVQFYPTYLDLVSHVFSLFGVMFLLCLPLVFVGFFRDTILNGWTLWLLAGSFSCLITPFCALDFWHRWMFILVYPFTFYAVNGVEKVLNSQSGNVHSDLRWLKRMKVSKRMVHGILLLTVLLGSIFMVTPLFFGRFGVFSIPNIHTYFPSTMLCNSITLQDVSDTVEVMKQLNERMDDSSCVLVHNAFLSWANLYLDKKHCIVYYSKDVDRALNEALTRDFDHIYWIWWNENIGWYDLYVPKDFLQPVTSGRISVFRIS